MRQESNCWRTVTKMFCRMCYQDAYTYKWSRNEPLCSQLCRTSFHLSTYEGHFLWAHQFIFIQFRHENRLLFSQKYMHDVHLATYFINLVGKLVPWAHSMGSTENDLQSSIYTLHVPLISCFKWYSTCLTAGSDVIKWCPSMHLNRKYQD